MHVWIVHSTFADLFIYLFILLLYYFDGWKMEVFGFYGHARNDLCRDFVGPKCNPQICWVWADHKRQSWIYCDLLGLNVCDHIYSQSAKWHKPLPV